MVSRQEENRFSLLHNISIKSYTLLTHNFLFCLKYIEREKKKKEIRAHEEEKEKCRTNTNIEEIKRTFESQRMSEVCSCLLC